MFNDYDRNIRKAYDAISDAENIVIGVGSGLSAAGGLNYGSQEFFKEHYPQYAKLGYKTIGDIMGKFWMNIDKENACKYWGFWSHPLTK